MGSQISRLSIMVMVMITVQKGTLHNFPLHTYYEYKAVATA
jgi:hypothetical protein